MRRSARLLAAAGATALSTSALATAATAHAASPTLANWDQSQQRQVVRAGLMHNAGGSFDGAGRLTARDANAAIAALAAKIPTSATSPGSATPPGGATTPAAAATTTTTTTTAAPTTTTTSTPVARVTGTVAGGAVTVTAFDKVIVEQLGLSDVAAHVQAATAAAGLRPPSYYGTEVVARFLGLRYNHPASTDQLELYPYEPITRAEAAWSFAQVLGFGDWTAPYARQTLTAFKLPKLVGSQAEALRIAVSRVGYPYVWGGTTDDTSDGLSHGGFDCSGFVWRVFKLSGLNGGRQIGGRTAAQMAGEIPRNQRLRMSQLQPGDLLFFGSARFNDRASEQNVYHTGIYLGGNWVIHSSSQGVYVLPLKGSWLGSSFAWARRVIN